MARRLSLALAAAVGYVLYGCALAETGAIHESERLLLARLNAPEAPGDPVTPLPKILSDADTRRYRHLFAAQEAGDWALADELIAALDDRLLMGHVLFQRYMHPTAWRSRFDELAAWLHEFSDHPGAVRIYRLALRRRPDGAAMPVEPDDWSLTGHGEIRRAGLSPELPTRDLSGEETKAVAALRRAVGGAVSKGDPAGAEATLANASASRSLTAAEVDSLKAWIARGYFAAGDDAAAARLAEAAAERSGALVPEARWTAGMAAWRRGDAETAARHFTVLANASRLVPNLVAGGAFWAARAYRKLGLLPAADRMLRLGAAYPRSIYGLMALRQLGEFPVFDWDKPRLGLSAVRLLNRNPAARRAMALAETGNAAGAEAELRVLYPRVGHKTRAALLILAERLKLPGLEIRLGSQLAVVDGRRHDHALYPLPGWEPDGGFRIDRALMFAVMRRESMFDPDAKSRAGARGLMQLMPATANSVDGRTDYRGGAAAALLAPERNLALGQRYLDRLLDRVSNNLIHTLAAYNAGPSRLAGWRDRLDETDPMLFLESLPSFETRQFVRSVLANLWIYRHRLGQHPDSLDELAAGQWPAYHAHDRLARLADLTETP